MNPSLSIAAYRSAPLMGSAQISPHAALSGQAASLPGSRGAAMDGEVKGPA